MNAHIVRRRFSLFFYHFYLFFHKSVVKDLEFIILSVERYGIIAAATIYS